MPEFAVYSTECIGNSCFSDTSLQSIHLIFYILNSKFTSPKYEFVFCSSKVVPKTFVMMNTWK